MAATSFISEHSSEYILVLRLIGILTPRFRRVVAIYFRAILFSIPDYSLDLPLPAMLKFQFALSAT
jgi:hypothetical protein